MLHVEICEGKELKPMDFNGLSNPLCTLFISSKPHHTYTTSTKPQTLKPIWDEHFSLYVNEPIII